MKTLVRLLVLLCAVNMQSAVAQTSLTASNDTTLCAGAPVQLNVTGATTYTWSPASSLSNANIANPVATPTVTTTYVVTAQVTGNMVVNGTFDDGNTGFTSGYTYTPAPNTSGPGYYWVGNSFTAFSAPLTTCPASDHTGGSGNGNMFIADGSTTANTPAWCETFNVVPNANYTLSGYLKPLIGTNLSKAQWMVNGTLIGTATTSYITCLWINPTTTWNAGVNTSATFCLVDPITQANGNDFALDDITITGPQVLSDTVVVTVLPPPVVNLGNDTSVCSGQPVILNAGNIGAAYNWSTGAITQSVTANNPGLYWVRVNNGCIASDSINISVANPPAAFNFGNDTTYCGSFSRNLNTGSASSHWNTGASGAQITVSAAGTYWAVDSNQCGVQRDTIMLAQNTAPVVSLGADTAICSVQTVTFDAGNAGATYAWSNGPSTQTISVTNPGNYAVTVTDGVGCTATDAVVVSAYTVPLSLTTVSTSCGLNNGSVTADIPGGRNPFVYVWSNTATSATISNLSAGNYDVTATDASGCSASASATVNSSGNNSVTATTNASTICASDSAHICAPSGYIHYQWNTGDTSNCIYTNLAGNYTVTVTDVGNCTASSNHVAINVYAAPSVSITVNGDTLTSYNGITYQWYFNGAAIQGATSNVYVATQTGNYSVEISDANNCYAVSNAVNIVAGINDVAAGRVLNVCPNPSRSGNWYVQVNNGLLGSAIQIYDAGGKLLYTSVITNLVSEINIDAASGVYIMHIAGNSRSYNIKLVKL